MKSVSRIGGRRMKSPNGPWQRILELAFISQRKFDMKPSCTRLRQKAKRLSSEGSEAIEYARVISSPSGLFVLSESHWPGTKPNRFTCSSSNSRCLVTADNGMDRSSFAVNV